MSLHLEAKANEQLAALLAERLVQAMQGAATPQDTDTADAAIADLEHALNAALIGETPKPNSPPLALRGPVAGNSPLAAVTLRISTVAHWRAVSARAKAHALICAISSKRH